MTSKKTDSKSRKAAVALHYDGKNAPHILASGHGEFARQILDLAEQHDIPVSEDPAMTEILSALPVGETIPEALYIAVAELLVWAYEINDKPAPIDI
ncbi:MAG: EscU/YscU/HrcU family type III secretion system export apparatus switch protein [bacterium]